MDSLYLKRLIALVVLAPAVALGAANDMLFMQRNSTDTATGQRLIPPPATDGLFYFNATTLLPGTVTVGSGLILSSGMLSASAPSFSLTTTGSGAASYNSGTGVLNVPTPTAVSRSFSYPIRPLNTCFQPSGTRDTQASYVVEVSASLSLTGGQQGTLYLELFTDNSCTLGTQEVARFTNGNSGALTIGLGLTQVMSGVLTGVVPAGAYVKIRTQNNTGTPTFTARPGQEVQL